MTEYAVLFEFKDCPAFFIPKSVLRLDDLGEILVADWWWKREGEKNFE